MEEVARMHRRIGEINSDGLENFFVPDARDALRSCLRGERSATDQEQAQESSSDRSDASRPERLNLNLNHNLQGSRIKIKIMIMSKVKIWNGSRSMVKNDRLI